MKQSYCALLLSLLTFMQSSESGSATATGHSPKELRVNAKLALASKDLEAADRLFAQACQKGDAWSCRDRGRLAIKQGLYLRAARHLSWACTGGIPKSCPEAVELWTRRGAIQIAKRLRNFACVAGIEAECTDAFVDTPKSENVSPAHENQKALSSSSEKATAEVNFPPAQEKPPSEAELNNVPVLVPPKIDGPADKGFDYWRQMLSH